MGLASFCCVLQRAHPVGDGWGGGVWSHWSWSLLDCGADPHANGGLDGAAMHEPTLRRKGARAPAGGTGRLTWDSYTVGGEQRQACTVEAPAQPSPAGCSGRPVQDAAHNWPRPPTLLGSQLCCVAIALTAGMGSVLGSQTLESNASPFTPSEMVGERRGESIRLEMDVIAGNNRGAHQADPAPERLASTRGSGRAIAAEIGQVMRREFGRSSRRSTAQGRYTDSVGWLRATTPGRRPPGRGCDRGPLCRRRSGAGRS